MRTHTSPILWIAEHEVFVFGSNLQGFHGAGSAGFASFGVPGNRWREFRYDRRPDGWKGLFAVKGLGKGLQRGTAGWGYALPTVTRAGAKRSRRPDQIVESIRSLYATARHHQDLVFLVAQSTGRGLNGYTPAEMAAMFRAAGPIPENISFDEGFAKLV